MKIAVCDDDEKMLTNLRSKVYDYSNLHNWDSVVDVFHCGEELLLSKSKYEIIILDYKMKNIDGIQTAESLRSGKNKFTKIIFLTSYPEIAIPAYSVDTFRFVVKNTLYEGLFKALDDFRNSSSFDYDISLKTDDDYVTVNTGKICYVETRNKISRVFTADGTVYETKTSLSDIFSRLPATHFFRIHKAFAVNFKYIEKRTYDTIILMANSGELPVSKNYASKFKTAYYNYLRDNMR